MTEKLTIKDLSCENCKYAEETNSNEYPFKCTISKPVPMMVHTWALAWLKYCGCASHPLALQVLTAPVIEELENRQKQCDWDYGDECAYGHTAFGDAIKLLKEGVKKP
jgi:hypothetical protein